MVIRGSTHLCGCEEDRGRCWRQSVANWRCWCRVSVLRSSSGMLEGRGWGK